MSEKMYPIPFASLMNWVVTEYAQRNALRPRRRPQQPARAEHHRRLLRRRPLL